MTARTPTMTNSALRASASTVSALPAPVSHLPRPATLPVPRVPGSSPGVLLTVTPSVGLLPPCLQASRIQCVAVLPACREAAVSLGGDHRLPCLQPVIVTVRIAKL